MSPADKDVEKAPTLAQMYAPARAISLGYWESGYIEGHAKGWEAGYAAAWDELGNHWGVRPLRNDDEQRAYANRLASAIDYPTLCERRGEYTRAARFRAAYRLLGILPGPIDGEG